MPSCRVCGLELQESWNACPSCGTQINGAVTVVHVHQKTTKKDKNLAYFLQFIIPGIGNLYLQDSKRGIALICIWFLIFVPLNLLGLTSPHIENLCFTAIGALLFVFYSLTTINLSFRDFQEGS